MKQTININGFLLDLATPKIMGILNITPDSFYDGGKHQSDNAIRNAMESMVRQGVDIIDVGAQSTRPNASFLNADEEWERWENAMPILEEYKDKVIFSVDTFWAKVAQQVHAVLPDMIINDISGGQIDDTMFETAAKLGCPYVLSHIKGTPQTMQQHTEYKELIPEITFYFSEKIATLKRLGVNDIILDVGFGFAKTIDQNFELLKKLSFFQNLRCPLLVGLSRKSMIWKTLNQTPAETLPGTVALNLYALQQGANILRVHDVQAGKDTVKLYEKLG